MKRFSEMRKHIWQMMIGLVLMMIICLGGVSVQAEGKVRLRIDLEDITGEHLPEAEVYDGGDWSYRSAVSSGWSYGSQLTGNARQIYNTLVNVGDMLSVGDKNRIFVKYMRPYGFTSISGMEKAAASAEKDLAKASHAYIRDFGEDYWINYFNVWIIQNENGDSLAEAELIPGDYYGGIRSEIALTDRELQKAVNAVKKVSGRYEKVKAAHDYVVDLVRYNIYDLDAPYGHTITGGLLEKYGHWAVCECYAKLFRLICNENGIPCVLITGGSEKDKNGNVIVDHMWNYVQMEDGKWYLVDTTWDDDLEDYSYFLVGANSPGNKGITPGEDHLPVGRFGTVDYTAFGVPPLSSEGYGEADNLRLQVNKIELKQAALELDVDEGNYIRAEWKPANATKGMSFAYSSSNTSIASVDVNGYVTGKKAGKAVITVTSKENSSVKAACTVTVKDHQYDKGEVRKKATVLAKGEKVYTCRNGCGKTITKSIPKKKAYVKLNQTSIPLQVKASTTAVKVSKKDSTDRVDFWTSSNRKVAEVDRRTGKITGKKKGTAKITVTMKSGVKAVCRVTVQKSAVKTRKITLSKTKIILKKNKSYTVKVSRSPLTANDKLTFSSSARKVATVNSKGKITARKKGQAVITARAASGKKARITVLVK